MKLKLTILLLSLFFISCSQDDDKSTVVSEKSLTGTWQLIERYDGGSTQPKQLAENGLTIEFTETGEYIREGFINCNYQDIESESEIIVICDTIELIYDYDFFDNGDLRLFITPTTCIEGCYDRFKNNRMIV
jgi:hypothetical protein